MAQAQKIRELLVPNKLIVFQTSDASVYFDMLISTSKTVREFCNRSGAAYECYVGVKRGFWNWQSAYNRIPIFSEIFARGHRSWVLYMDADAYIADFDFDIAAYLEKVARFGAVMIPSGASPALWDVNSGVLMLNLGSRVGVTIMERWSAAFAGISDETLRRHEVPFTGPEDQVLLHNLLKEDNSLWSEIHLESPDLMNSARARFIRQNLRSLNPDFPSRQRAITEAVERILKGQNIDDQKSLEEQLISAAYEAILGRSPDKIGLADYTRSLEIKGLERGLKEMIRSLMNSQEYGRKQEKSSQRPLAGC
jgi:hypothetical protein